MRRGVETDTQPGALADGVEHGRDAALAVGAGDVDEAARQRRRLVRVAHQRQQGADVLQAQLDAEKLDAVEVFDCLFVSHRA